MSKTELVIDAFAKINLGLRVLSKRPDGYHQIETLLQSIDLHDTLTLKPLHKPEIHLEIASPWPLPQGQANLVYRAAERVLSHRGVHIRLEKHIPVGAGLGGGSSDAAATLVGLNELFQLQLSNTKLYELALGLGSDVPFFLIGGLCRGQGRGEILEKLPARFDGYSFLLVSPNCSLSTEAVYREYDALPAHERPAAPIYDAVDCTNDLEEAAMRLCPELQKLRQALLQFQPDVLGMSGSGPTYYAGWRSPPTLAVAHQLTQMGYTVYHTRPTPHGYKLAQEREAH